MLIANRFTKSFILENITFILKNNYFSFDTDIWHQDIGTAMETNFASPYACLTIGFLEETCLFPKLIPSYFNITTCQSIENNYFQYVDDGISIIPLNISPELMLTILNSMHPAIQFTLRKSILTNIQGEEVSEINFLSIKIYVTESGRVKTNVFYKVTNAHDYLPYDSHHPTHVKNNIPYVLAKRIIVFTTDSELQEEI